MHYSNWLSLFLVLFFLSGCSGSSDPATDDSATAKPDAQTATDSGATEITDDPTPTVNTDDASSRANWIGDWQTVEGDEGWKQSIDLGADGSHSSYLGGQVSASPPGYPWEITPAANSPGYFQLSLHNNQVSVTARLLDDGSAMYIQGRDGDVEFKRKPPKESAPANSADAQTALPTDTKHDGEQFDDTKKFRAWTDESGEFKTDAQFIEVNDGTVRLKKTNGQILSVPLERLSARDQRIARAASLENVAQDLIDRGGTRIKLGKQSFPAPAGTYKYRIKADITELATDGKGDLAPEYPAIKKKIDRLIDDASRFDLTKPREIGDYAGYVGKELSLPKGKQVERRTGDAASL